MQGTLRKMTTRLDDVVQYDLPVGDTALPLNPLIGQPLSLHFLGQIFCQACGRKTKKSFSQGYCYPCMNKLAACDMCILKPEKCHYEQGTCREPEWADNHCMVNHIVYLANTSGLKVGITRETQVPTRWMDQGATQALPIFRVSSRLDSGLVEVSFTDFVADKTAWQAMLKGANEDLDMAAERDRLVALAEEQVEALLEDRGLDPISALSGADVVSIDYPVLEYPVKVKSLTFDKQPSVSGTLMGIKGQYLILDTGVLNIRKFSGYKVQVDFR